MLDSLFWLIKRDLTLVMRKRADLFIPLLFFVIVVSLFPLAIGPDIPTLRLIAPGVIWVGSLLAVMLALGQLFDADYQDGSLEQTMLAPQPLFLLALGKVIAHWLITGLPLVIISPILGLQYALSGDVLLAMIYALLLGTPTLSLLGGMGAALTLGLNGSSALLALLILPLYIPVLIFGAGAVEATASGLGGAAHLSMLGAILLIALLCTPFATAAALRITVN